MNKFLTNLLLLLTLALCGLSTFQWMREAKLQKEILALSDIVHSNQVTIQGLEVATRREQAETSRLEKIRLELNATAAASQTKMAGLERRIEQLSHEADERLTTLDQYKAALETANGRLRAQNEDIRQQNQVIEAVAEQRDAKALELGKVVGDYNTVVKDHNRLVA
ncbi:MAG: hypothetical protein ACYC23_22530, partial [Limisphaerales bacterium]